MTQSKDTLVFNGFEPANTTPVPDVLFDVLLPYLNEAQLKVMLYIIRRTLGFKKTSDAISLNQFRWGITTKEGKKLDDGCGLKNFTTISNALKELEQMNCIESDKRETDEGNKLTTVYRIRFRGTTPNVVGTTDSVVGVLRQTYDRTTPNGGRVLRQTEPQETVIQDTVKQETERERIPAPESDATFSPPSVGERSQSLTCFFCSKPKGANCCECGKPVCSEHGTHYYGAMIWCDLCLDVVNIVETHSHEGDRDALLDTAGRLPAVGTGVGRGGEDIQPDGEIDNTFSEKGQNDGNHSRISGSYPDASGEPMRLPGSSGSRDLGTPYQETLANLPTSTPAQPLPPGTEQAAPGAKGKGKKQTESKPEMPKSPPVEPPSEMPWGTRKCLQWFDFWRGGILIGKWKLMQASNCAKGLAEQFDEQTVIAVRHQMEADPYYIAKGGCDVCDVANNIHKYLKRKHLQVIPGKAKQQHWGSSFDDPNYTMEGEFYTKPGQTLLTGVLVQ